MECERFAKLFERLPGSPLGVYQFWPRNQFSCNLLSGPVVIMLLWQQRASSQPISQPKYINVRPYVNESTWVEHGQTLLEFCFTHCHPFSSLNTSLLYKSDSYIVHFDIFKRFIKVIFLKSKCLNIFSNYRNL